MVFALTGFEKWKNGKKLQISTTKNFNRTLQKLLKKGFN